MVKDLEKVNEIKNLVREKYSEIAQQSKEHNLASCCGATSTCCVGEVYNIMSDNYTDLEGYVADADLGLGCGLPTEFAKIKRGDTVIDLGSGAGNDCFVARHECGAEGRVIGIDFTDAMIDLARKNAEKLKLNNVEFRQGDIEKMPISDGIADVVVSNCVLNLVPNKAAVFAEIKRVLKAGGHFSISDVVLEGELPQALRQAAEMYAGCVAGAMQKKDYLKLIDEAGFVGRITQKEKVINIPDEILADYLTPDEILAYRASDLGIFSITVFAQKPTQQPAEKEKNDITEGGEIPKITLQVKEKSCCPPNSGCC